MMLALYIKPWPACSLNIGICLQTKPSPSVDHCMRSIYSCLCYQQIPVEILSWFSLLFLQL